MAKITDYLQLARPHQYVKNGFVWLPLFFGHKLGDVPAVVNTLWAFLAFCLAASAVYVYNDIRDVEFDRRHPRKKLRPLASGAVKTSQAVFFLIVLLVLSTVVLLFFLPFELWVLIGVYVLLNAAYSNFLKHQAILDVTTVALGFVLRILAGGISASVAVSHWIVLMTFLLALFLAFAKRRDDLLVTENHGGFRKSLDGYNIEFVSGAMMITASVTLVAYILYTVSPEIIAKHKTEDLYTTAFWVMLGVMRYLQIAFVRESSGSPTQVLLKDPFIQIVILLWLVHFYLFIYV